MQIVFD